MNVLIILITVTSMLHVKIHLVALHVFADLGSQKLEKFVQVSNRIMMAFQSERGKQAIL